MADQPDHPPAERGDKSWWNLLLIPAVVLPLLPMLYNADGPRLLGFPRFYWLQLAFIALGVSCTVLVYRMTKRLAAAGQPAGTKRATGAGRK